MRLLEFNRDEGGANPIMANPGSLPKAIPASVPEAAAAPSPAVTAKPASKRSKQTRKARVFPLKSRSVAQTRGKPVDLEQLQQRVAVLERRIRARSEAPGGELVAKDLEKLKQRMKLLERNIGSELWAAKQREYTLLQMLAKPTFTVVLKQGFKKFKTTTIPAVVKSLGETYRQWWSDSQPGWWASFATAWQESLERARSQHRD